MEGGDDERAPKPPPKKVGFKGKRPKAKFSRNVKLGKNQSKGISRQRYLDSLASAAAPANLPSPTQRAIASVTSRAAIASPTKQQMKAALSRTTKDLRNAAAARDVAIAKNSRLEKKLSVKELTVHKAKAELIKYKAATKKSERGRARLERALQCERNLRHEDAIAAEEALQRERHEFQIYLKAAISEVKVSFYI